MSKVVALRGAETPTEPVPQVVDMLRELLARAEAGELRAVAYAAVCADRTSESGWAKPDLGPASVMQSLEEHALGSAMLHLTIKWTLGNIR